MTFISRILGFVRDALVAQMYGVNAAVDAFNVAFKIPNFMRNLFAEGCFSQAFVPVLAEYRSTRSLDETKTLIQHVAGGLGLFLLILTIIGIFIAPLIIMLFAPGYHPSDIRFTLASYMLRITFPYLMLISLTALASSVLNSFRQFAAPAFTPALLNLCLIGVAVFLSPHLAIPVEAQAWGVLIAGFVQLFFLLYFLHRQNLLVWPKVHFGDPGVNRILKLMLPALFGASIGQLSLLLNTIFASFLVVGSVSWLYYSDRLAFFPLGVFGVALATVVLPHLSAKHATKSSADYSKALDWGIRCNLIIGFPAMVCLIILAGPLVSTLFQYGRFSPHDVLMTRASVLAYSFGLPSFMLVKVLSAAFYAKQDTKTPVRLGVYSIVSNMVLNAILIWPLAHVGLALASSLGSWINSILLYYMLRKHNIYQAESGWWRFGGQLLGANLVLAAWLFWQANNLQQWLTANWHWKFLHVAYLGCTGIIIYILCLFILGLRWNDLRLTQ